jgi:hypothetical protein
MAIGALLSEQHSFMRDRESFFWVLFWICIHCDGPSEGKVVAHPYSPTELTTGAGDSEPNPYEVAEWRVAEARNEERIKAERRVTEARNEERTEAERRVAEARNEALKEARIAMDRRMAEMDRRMAAEMDRRVAEGRLGAEQ